MAPASPRVRECGGELAAVASMGGGKLGRGKGMDAGKGKPADFRKGASGGRQGGGEGATAREGP